MSAWDSPESHSHGWNRMGRDRGDPEKWAKSAGRARLVWLRQSGRGQEAGFWIPEILTELSGAGEAAPGSAPPAGSAHFPRQPRGEAAFLPAPRFLSAASSHPRVAADNARGRTLPPPPHAPHSSCPRGVCGSCLGDPSLPVQLSRGGWARTQRGAAAPPAAALGTR